MTRESVIKLVEQHYDKGIIIPIGQPYTDDEGRVYSINALTGFKSLDGTVNREGLKKSFKSQEWLFTDSIAEDIALEESEFENWIHKCELKF